MVKDFNSSADISPDSGDDVNCDDGPDFDGNLAGNTGIDLNDDNYQNPGDDANEANLPDAQPYKPSALHNIMTAGVSGVHSPSDLAQAIGAWCAPPGAEDVYAEALQAAANMGVAGSKEFQEIFDAETGENLTDEKLRE
jgi:hypothetical protein